MANAFDTLRDETGESWNTANRVLLEGFKLEADKTIREAAYATFTNKDVRASQKSVYESILSDIKSALNVGKTPKREDFINAVKKVEDIKAVIGAATQIETSLHPNLIGLLIKYAGEALTALEENTPGKISAGTKAIGAKMKSTAGGFLKGMVSQMTAGIPFAPELMELAGSKIKGVVTGRGVSEEQKEMASMLGGVSTGGAGGGNGGDGDGNGDGNGNGDENGNGHGPNGGLSGVVQSLNRIEALLTTGLFGSPPFLQTISETLGDMLKVATPDAEAGREEERERELERLEDAKKGGKVAGKPEDKKGLFGDFSFANLFKKGGIKKLIATLGGTLLSGMTSAFASTGMVGKGLLAKLGPMLMKVAGPAALLAGVAMAIQGGVDGWFASKEWGVSNIAGALGGLFGGTDPAGSFKGVSKNALKWGLIGAGLGSIVPVIGTGIGFAVGALFGGILGYFGGEKIAKAIQAVGDWVSDKMSNILKFLGLKEKTKEDHEKEIEEERNAIEMRLKSIRAAQEKTKKARTDFTSAASAGKAGGFVSEEAQQKALTRQQEKEKEYVQQLVTLKEESGVVKETGVRATEGEMQEKVENAKEKLEQAKSQAAKRPSILEDRKYRHITEPADQEILKKSLLALAARNNYKEYWENKVRILTENLKKWGVEGYASGGYIVNRPTYLPSSGVVVGEHPSYSGRGTPRDGGPEALIRGAADGLTVLPLENSPIVSEFAKKTGAIMNQMAMERVGYERGRGSMYNQPPTIIDASTVQNVSNNTLIRPPSPSGPGLHFERRDFVHKIA